MGSRFSGDELSATRKLSSLALSLFKSSRMMLLSILFSLSAMFTHNSKEFKGSVVTPAIVDHFLGKRNLAGSSRRIGLDDLAGQWRIAGVECILQSFSESFCGGIAGPTHFVHGVLNPFLAHLRTLGRIGGKLSSRSLGLDDHRFDRIARRIVFRVDLIKSRTRTKPLIHYEVRIVLLHELGCALFADCFRDLGFVAAGPSVVPFVSCLLFLGLILLFVVSNVVIGLCSTGSAFRLKVAEFGGDCNTLDLLRLQLRILLQIAPVLFYPIGETVAELAGSQLAN